MEYSYPTVFRNRRSEKESETKIIIDQLRRLDLGFNHTGLLVQNSLACYRKRTKTQL